MDKLWYVHNILLLSNKNEVTPSLSTPIQHHSTRSPSQSNQGGKRKDIRTGKEEVILSLCPDNMVFYIEN